MDVLERFSRKGYSNLTNRKMVVPDRKYVGKHCISIDICYIVQTIAPVVHINQSQTTGKKSLESIEAHKGHL